MSGIGEWEAFMWEADDTIVTAAGAPVHVPAPVPVQEAGAPDVPGRISFI